MKVRARLVFAAFVAANAAFAQSSRDTLEMERLAARAAMQLAVPVLKASQRVAIEPMMVKPDQAPGGAAIALRDSARSAALAAEFRGRVGALKDADIAVTLSTPVALGEYGHVTVTIHERAERRLHYVTYNVRMKRSGGKWSVVGVDQLGVS